MHQIGSLLAAPFRLGSVRFGPFFWGFSLLFGSGSLLSWARKITPNKFIISVVFSFFMISTPLRKQEAALPPAHVPARNQGDICARLCSLAWWVVSRRFLIISLAFLWSSKVGAMRGMGLALQTDTTTHQFLRFPIQRTLQLERPINSLALGRTNFGCH